MMDWADMAAGMAAIVADNSVAITIRRGAATLAAQTVRIAGKGGGGQRQSDGAQTAAGSVVVVGGLDFDVQPQDRFTHGGDLYEVVYIPPNRRAAVVAEARLVQ